ncbi:LysR family transcriptional regulator [Reinekea marinisedimentorum]|uniref:DNA-binding transcriptional LysR family regulator n=1 Tax=Reinekea marinisedimentorum TaxID=230495 RepID=A0A4R3IBZ0_9GAMM|nr:LysR family transcriptional regulator [Reinekea marinisedimentorum]TCS42028.1 DNA-binding transcriptional LysR family regulator [Reinekea marinisedimentorum]
MSLTRMRTFIEVFRQNSINKAAKSLNLTQPAVSQHIAALEVVVGYPLFERSSSGVVPTAAATELALEIGDKLDAAEAALAAARARSMDITGVLQVVGHADFLAEILSEQLLPLLESGIKVRMHTGSREIVTSMLLEGHCDLGVSAYPVIDNRLKSEKIYTTRALPVASPAVAERLNNAADFTQAISEEPLLTYNLELTLIDRWLTKNRINIDRVTPSMVSLDLRALRKLVICGYGWTILPEFLCTEHLHSGKLAQLPSPIGTHEIDYYLIWLPSALRTARVAHARQLLLNQKTLSQ